MLLSLNSQQTPSSLFFFFFFFIGSGHLCLPTIPGEIGLVWKLITSASCEVFIFTVLSVIGYRVTVLCPGPQDRGSSKPLLAAGCDFSSIFGVLPSLLASLPTSQFLPIRAECCHTASLSSFLFPQKNRIITAPAAFSTVVLCCSAVTFQTSSPASALSLHTGYSLFTST